MSFESKKKKKRYRCQQAAFSRGNMIFCEVPILATEVNVTGACMQYELPIFGFKIANKGTNFYSQACKEFCWIGAGSVADKYFADIGAAIVMPGFQIMAGIRVITDNSEFMPNFFGSLNNLPEA